MTDYIKQIIYIRNHLDKGIYQIAGLQKTNDQLDLSESRMQHCVPVAEAHDRTLIALSSINSFYDGKVSVSLMSKMQVSKRYFFTLLNLS